MTPRISLPPRIANLNLCFRPAVRPTSQSQIISVANASTKAQRRPHRDPYALAQAKQKRLANLKRRKELQDERQAALGDPVRGITTPFVKSFDTAISVSYLSPNQELNDPVLNHFLKPAELETAFQHSHILTQPVISTTRDLADPAREAESIQKHAEDHERAIAAISRIVDLANGNQKDRTRTNVERCIDIFGRHNTDQTLRPRIPSTQTGADPVSRQVEKTPRAGPDTGSSEVQIAILTAKIRVLADKLEEKGGKSDKVMKRNLRLLVHRRQKLLAYLRRKERGGDRWQNLIETLGLTDGTWKGEITL